ncbi:hypothetical protein [Streptomyces sp. NPDC048641]|uniref:hypothetical protein n=1 Tax=Streptomyces sp. NPDC048641 TaxID=3154825 RepID=UPI003434E0AE
MSSSATRSSTAGPLRREADQRSTRAPGACLWVLLGLVKADLGDFQKTALKWGIPVSLAYIAFALLTGAITIV